MIYTPSAKGRIGHGSISNPASAQRWFLTGDEQMLIYKNHGASPDTKWTELQAYWFGITERRANLTRRYSAMMKRIVVFLSNHTKSRLVNGDNEKILME